MFMHEHQTYKPSLTAAAALERIDYLLRAADQSASPPSCPPATRTGPQDADSPGGGGAFNGPLD